MSKEKALSLLYLGFDESANPTEEEIQKAYKVVAKVLHPDGSGSNEQFRGLTIARDVLLECAPKKKKPAPKQEKQSSFDYFKQEQERRNREDIKRVENEICEALTEALDKLPKRIYYIYFRLMDDSLASVKIVNGKFKTIQIQGSSDSYISRVYLLSRVRFMNQNYKDWKYFERVDITLKMYSRFGYYFMKWSKKLPGLED